MSKILYLYDKDTKQYIAEKTATFCKKTFADTGEKVYISCENSTEVAPDFEPYMTAFFDESEGKWYKKPNVLYKKLWDFNGVEYSEIYESEQENFTDIAPPSDALDGCFFDGKEWHKKSGINTKKSEIIEKIFSLYNEAIKIRVKNGVDFTISLSSSDGEALLKIISNSVGSYTDENKAREVFSFFAEENLNGIKTQHETRMYAWLWQYLFGELPFIYQKLSQLKKNLLMLVDSCKSVEDVEAIDVSFPAGFCIDISETMRYILSREKDEINGEEIIIPDFIKSSIQGMNREIFYQVAAKDISKEIYDIVNKSFLSKN